MQPLLALPMDMLSWKLNTMLISPAQAIDNDKAVANNLHQTYQHLSTGFMRFFESDPPSNFYSKS